MTPYRLGHLDEDLGVAARLRYRLHASFIARVLGGDGERALEPPGERVEPEDRAIEPRQQGRQCIATTHVLALVRDDRGERFGRPRFPRKRKHDDGTDDTGGHGDNHFGGFVHSSQGAGANRRP